MWLGPSGGAWLLLQLAKRRLDPESAEYQALYRDFLPFFWVEHFGLFRLLGSGILLLSLYGFPALEWTWLRRVLVGMMATLSAGRILDLAGGRGEMARRLAAPGRAVVVLEPSLDMIRGGRGECPNEVAWVAGLARALPFPDASMEAVVCAFGMRNVTFAKRALKEVMRVLKPGGHFYCL